MPLGLWDYCPKRESQKVNTEKNEDLESLVDSLTKNISSKDEKARAIFNWVQNNV